MSSITAIASDTTALNLSLAGIRVEEMTDMKEVETRVNEILDDPTDVLILEEAYRDAFSERMQDRMSRHKGAPLIIYCPAFEDDDTDVDAYLSAVIKPAVGFEIRLG